MVWLGGSEGVVRDENGIDLERYLEVRISLIRTRIL